jgi:elongation factor P hydroxylase
MAAAQHFSPDDSACYSSRRLEILFERCFLEDYHTRLIGGALEPLYRPGRGTALHQLYYRQDYFASALHEVAHWCIAGQRRRQQEDFGYWYAPDGRDQKTQRSFEQVEAKPQALEWHFSRACGYRFRLSVDNLDGCSDGGPSEHFRQSVLDQATVWDVEGLQQRAANFVDALRKEFRPQRNEPFTLVELD